MQRDKAAPGFKLRYKGIINMFGTTPNNTPNNTPNPSLPNNHIRTIHESHFRRIWVGHFQHGYSDSRKAPERICTCKGRRTNPGRSKDSARALSAEGLPLLVPKASVSGEVLTSSSGTLNRSVPMPTCRTHGRIFRLQVMKGGRMEHSAGRPKFDVFDLFLASYKRKQAMPYREPFSARVPCPMDPSQRIYNNSRSHLSPRSRQVVERARQVC